MDARLQKALDTLFHPESIAVVGSVKQGKIAQQIITQLRGGAYSGTIWAVNPKAQAPEGMPDVTGVEGVDRIEGKVDLAVICSPAATVEDVVKACGQKGVPVAVIITSGFGEIGKVEEERQLRSLAASYGMHLIGPNCAGIMNPHSNLFASIEVRALKGSVAFVTQSGAVGGAVLAMAEERGIGFSKFVSYGNRIDIGESQLLDYLEHDESTRAVAVYVESLQDGRDFMEKAREFTRKKPLILIKAGRTTAGNRAAGSHTGSFAGSDEVFNAMIRHTGAIRVKGLEEMLDLCQGFSLLPPVKGKKIAIVTNSGGPGILTADHAEELGLEVAVPSETEKTRLQEFLPGHSSVANPVDLTVEGTEENYRKSLETLLSGSYDSAVAINVGTPFLDSQKLARGVTQAAAASGKPVASVFMAGGIVQSGTKYLHEHRIPYFPTGERAVEVISTMAEYYTRQSQSSAPTGKASDSSRHRGSGRRLYAPVLMSEALDLLKDYGFSLPRYHFISKNQTPQAQASGLNFPMAMKVVSPSIVHKSDVGGVVLNLESMEEVQKAFSGMKTKLADQDFEGVILHEMIPQGSEIILGLKKDPTFGPVIVVGAGGIYTEIMRDVSLRIAPVSAQSALEQLQELKIFPLLSGFRGAGYLDVDSLVRQIVLLSELAMDHPEIQELDLNPLFVLENDAVVGDVHIAV